MKRTRDDACGEADRLETNRRSVAKTFRHGMQRDHRAAVPLEALLLWTLLDALDLVDVLRVDLLQETPRFHMIADEEGHYAVRATRRWTPGDLGATGARADLQKQGEGFSSWRAAGWPVNRSRASATQKNSARMGRGQIRSCPPSAHRLCAVPPRRHPAWPHLRTGSGPCPGLQQPTASRRTAPRASRAIRGRSARHFAESKHDVEHAEDDQDEKDDGYAQHGGKVFWCKHYDIAKTDGWRTAGTCQVCNAEMAARIEEAEASAEAAVAASKAAAAPVLTTELTTELPLPDADRDIRGIRMPPPLACQPAASAAGEDLGRALPAYQVAVQRQATIEHLDNTAARRFAEAARRGAAGLQPAVEASGYAPAQET